MAKFRNHYDNLMVSRNAAPEVIAAAYKALCRRFHPDLNQGDAGAARIMQIVNRSYAVLSDPIQRREHDKWIANQENMADDEPADLAPPSPSTVAEAAAKPVGGSLMRHLQSFGLLYLIVLSIGSLFFISVNPKPSGLPDYDPTNTVEVAPTDGTMDPQPQSPVAERPAYSRPSLAPTWSAMASIVRLHSRLCKGSARRSFNAHR